MEVKFKSNFINELMREDAFKKAVDSDFEELVKKVDTIIEEAEKRNNLEELIGAYNKSYSLVADNAQITSEQKQRLLKALRIEIIAGNMRSDKPRNIYMKEPY